MDNYIIEQGRCATSRPPRTERPPPRTPLLLLGAATSTEARLEPRASPAVLKVNMKMKTRLPPGSGPKSPKIIDFLSKLTVRTLPRTPRGEGDKNKLKNVLKYSWASLGVVS